MIEQTNKTSAQDQQKADNIDDRVVDPRDLVYRGGYNGDPREIVENPAVAPESFDQAPEDIRHDVIRDIDHGDINAE